MAQALVGTEAALGILPMGSGNDYIRALGIPRVLSGAVAVLARGRIRTVDVARVADEFALNSFGMGVEGQIAADYKRMRFLKGELGYLYATILELVRFRAFRAEVAGDGWSFAGKLLSVSVMNGPYAGGGYRLAPRLGSTTASSMWASSGTTRGSSGLRSSPRPGTEATSGSSGSRGNGPSRYRSARTAPSRCTWTASSSRSRSRSWR